MGADAPCPGKPHDAAIGAPAGSVAVRPARRRGRRSLRWTSSIVLRALQVLDAVIAAATRATTSRHRTDRSVAAAQVVAWLLVPDLATASPYSDTAVAWTQRCGGQPTQAMVAAARRALQRAQSDESDSRTVERDGRRCMAIGLRRIDDLVRQGYPGGGSERRSGTRWDDNSVDESQRPGKDLSRQSDGTCPGPSRR